jgi:hypothetical protein
MKGLIVALTIIAGLGGTALADTVTVLTPPPSGLANVHTVRCAGSGFTGGGALAGGCAYTLACTARYCHGKTYSYAVTWTMAGEPTLGALTAYPGQQGTGTVAMVDGTAYYYVATSVDGAGELVNGQSSALLVSF